MTSMSTTRSAVSIKGTKTGLQIVIDDTVEFEDGFAQLVARLESTDAFFQGARVALDVGNRVVSREEWSRLETELRQKNLILTAALAAQEQSRVAARALGIPLVTESRREMTVAERRHADRRDEEGNGEGLFVRRSVRSGQVVRHNGSIVIIGDVNSGAEVIAEGDVLVWGSLRGMVHAGASGDETATVSALHLAPTQLRLAGHIARSPSNRPRLIDVPEVASVRDGAIIVEEWSRMRRPINLSLRTLLFLALVYAVEAIALAAAIRMFPASWSPLYIASIVVAAIVLGWLVALLTVNRQER
jgi:septum site-determining protein MinC